MAAELRITVEFSGGLEMLFSNEAKHQVTMPSKTTDDGPTNIEFLIKYLCEHIMRDPRKELFVLDGQIRPGILVLINDVDWELEGEDKYELVDGDNVLFVSTLHGG